MSKVQHTEEEKVARAFTVQALVFDKLYGKDEIISYKRQRVRSHVLSFLKPGDEILELNCGTGEDALYFADKGYAVHATDVSTGMLEQLQQKISAGAGNGNVRTSLCSFTAIGQLEPGKQYPYIFSNFGGLNCTGQLNQVLLALSEKLAPGGRMTLVIISRFCLWELLLAFRGKWKTAFRRFFSRKGRTAKVEGASFRCWYYTPSFVRKHVGPGLRQLSLEGLCTVVPPSYMEGFAERWPRFYKALSRAENKWKSRWPWKYVGDYFIITLQRES